MLVNSRIETTAPFWCNGFTIRAQSTPAIAATTRPEIGSKPARGEGLRVDSSRGLTPHENPVLEVVEMNDDALSESRGNRWDTANPSLAGRPKQVEECDSVGAQMLDDLVR